MQRLQRLFKKNYILNDKAKLTWGRLFIVIFLAFLVQVLLNIIVAYLKSINIVLSTTNILYLNITHNLASIFLIISIYKWKFIKKAIVNLHMSIEEALNKGIYWGLIALLTNLLVGIIVLLIYSLLGIDADPQNATTIIEATKKSNALLVFISVVVTAPIAEELMFRGVIYRTLSNHFSSIVAIVLSGLVFSLIHMDWFFIIQIWSMGIVLAISYNKTGSIITPIIAHMVVNSMYFLTWI